MAENTLQTVPVRRTHFYVGGHYEDVTQPRFGDNKLMVGQMYVESVEPLKVTQAWPIVMIPGGGQTGANFLNTPDGRPGWTDYFLNQGYHVYIVDQVARGRSAWLPTADSSQVMVTIPQDFCVQQWTAPAMFKLWNQAQYHTQWPGETGLPGDPVFEAFYASQVPFVLDFNYSEALMQPAGLALLEKIGPAILLTHSQSALFGWGIADVAQPKGLVKGIVAIEPTGPPFIDRVSVRSKEVARPYGLTSIPITYDPPIASASDLQTVEIQPPSGFADTLSTTIQQDPNQSGGPRQLPRLREVPVLVVTSQASNHAAYDHGTVQYLRDAGVDVTWFKLADMGILGNAHFLFMEKNNEVIAERIHGWLSNALILPS